jgi:hypothetical protein
MKTKSALLPAAFAACAALLGPGAAGGRAAPLSQTTAVQTKPDPAAPVITFLKAGSESPPPASVDGVPAGWQAVEIPGPFDGYVLNKELTKNLEVKPGDSIYLAPDTGAGVLAVAAKGDKTEITGLHGRWTRIRLEKSLVGFIHAGPFGPLDSGMVQAAAPVAATNAPASVVALSSGPGRAAPDESAAAVPRSFEGRFVSTRTLLSPRRPYDWEIRDAAGDRSAYLDIGKLMLTEQIDKYVDHDVVVYGAVKTVPGGRDIVIEVESLQLK